MGGLQLLVENSSLTVALDPTVLAVVADTESRLGNKLSKCLCSLIGHVTEDGAVEVVDAYPNNCTPAGGEPTADAILPQLVHHERMLQFVQQTRPREILLGWAITERSFSSLQVLSDWHKSDPKASKFVPKKQLTSPIYLIVNLPKPDGTKLSYEAYSKGSAGFCFLSLPIKLRTSLSDSPILERMQAEYNGDRNSRVNGPMDLGATKSKIELTAAYVQAVLDGKIVGDPDIGRSLVRCFSSCTDLGTEFANSQTEESLLVCLVSQLAKLQFSISEKLAS